MESPADYLKVKIIQIIELPIRKVSFRFTLTIFGLSIILLGADFIFKTRFSHPFWPIVIGSSSLLICLYDVFCFFWLKEQRIRIWENLLYGEKRIISSLPSNLIKSVSDHRADFYSLKRKGYVTGTTDAPDFTRKGVVYRYLVVDPVKDFLDRFE